jgi:protein SCO1/2
MGTEEPVRTKEILILSLAIAGIALVIFLGIYLAYTKIKPGPAGIEGEFNPSGDFTLMEDNGKIFHLRDQRGKVVLLFFGYTSCPDVCPLTLAKLGRVRALLGPSAKKVLTVFVTVDPQRDTSARLKEYLGYFDADAVGLTGTKEQIDAVVRAYKASYQKVPTNSALGYIINHTNVVYLIDRQGKVRHLFHQDDSPGKMAEIIGEYI